MRSLCGFAAILVMLALAVEVSAQDFPMGIVGAKVKTVWNEKETECEITVEIQNLNRDSLTPVIDSSTNVDFRSFPRILNTALVSEVGSPELPYVIVNVEIPKNSKTSLLVKDVRTVADGLWDKLNIVPATEPWAEAPDAPKPNIVPNGRIYGSSSFFPERGASELGPQTTLRGGVCQEVHFYPVRFSPGLGIVNLQTITATLFVQPEATTAKEGWDTQRFAKAAQYSSDLEGIYLQWETNFKPPKEIARPDNEAGADYLVVVADSLSEEINRLTTRKVQSGLRVKTVRLTELGLDESSTDETRRTKIREWIDVQFNQARKPTYLLLVGDWQAIPPYKKTKHPYYNDEKVPTDLYYATLDSGMLPALAVGRLPARTTEELKIFLDKIIAYEDTLDAHATQGPWGRAIVAGDYENYVSRGRTVTSRWFHQTAYNVGLFVRQNPDVTTIQNVAEYYVADPASSPRPWHNYDGTTIPQDVLDSFVADDIAVNGIRDIWIQDVRLVLHRDHGHKGGWGTPSFGTNHIGLLNKPSINPVVFSINCETGWYDTDSSFALELMRSPNAAAGVIAASRVSYSKYNDRLTEGLIKAIWDTFEFDFQLPDRENAKRLGPILNAGKVHLYNSYKDDTARLTLELFNLLGDPDMRITRPRGERVLPNGVTPVRFPNSFGDRNDR